MDNRCDLHIHSNFSDSDTTVENIFKEAKIKGLRCIAITDHDTVGGIDSALEFSKIHNIEFIPAIEISAQHKEYEVHLLGYFINHKDPKLQSALQDISQHRLNRLIAMADKLLSAGFRIDKNDLLSRVKTAMPTRLHLGLYLIEKGLACNLRDAFRKFLAPGKTAYVARFKYSVQQAVQLIKDAGGLVFLAHPHMIPDQSWIDEFLSFGIDGLEVAYSNMSRPKHLRYMSMVLEKKLLKCGGSDAHGSYKEFTAIGAVSIPYEWVGEMKQRRLTNTL